MFFFFYFLSIGNRFLLFLLGKLGHLMQALKAENVLCETDHFWIKMYKNKNVQKVWQCRTNKPSMVMRGTKLKSLVSLQEWADALMVAKLWDNWKKKKKVIHLLQCNSDQGHSQISLQASKTAEKRQNCWSLRAKTQSLSFWHAPSLETLRMRGRN